MTLLLALLLLIAVRPADGGNHPRKELSQPQRGFHPPKELDL